LRERETGADGGTDGEREHDEPEGLHGSTVDTRSDTPPGAFDTTPLDPAPGRPVQRVASRR
jgi:hypothetical protein